MTKTLWLFIGYFSISTTIAQTTLDTTIVRQIITQSEHFVEQPIITPLTEQIGGFASTLGSEKLCSLLMGIAQLYKANTILEDQLAQQSSCFHFWSAQNLDEEQESFLQNYAYLELARDSSYQFQTCFAPSEQVYLTSEGRYTLTSGILSFESNANTSCRLSLDSIPSDKEVIHLPIETKKAWGLSSNGDTIVLDLGDTTFLQRKTVLANAPIVPFDTYVSEQEFYYTEKDHYAASVKDDSLIYYSSLAVTIPPEVTAITLLINGQYTEPLQLDKKTGIVKVWMPQPSLLKNAFVYVHYLYSERSIHPRMGLALQFLGAVDKKKIVSLYMEDCNTSTPKDVFLPKK